MLEKKHLVFLAGATAPFAPPLCTALDVLLINLMHPGSNNDVLKRWKWYNFERMMRQCISSLYDTVVENTSRWIDHESVCVPFQTNCFNNC